MSVLQSSLKYDGLLHNVAITLDRHAANLQSLPIHDEYFKNGMDESQDFEFWCKHHAGMSTPTSPLSSIQRGVDILSSAELTTKRGILDLLKDFSWKLPDEDICMLFDRVADDMDETIGVLGLDDTRHKIEYADSDDVDLGTLRDILHVAAAQAGSHRDQSTGYFRAAHGGT